MRYRLVLTVAGLILVALVVAACSSGGWSLPWSRGGGTTPPPASPDPFGSLWWIAPAGVLCGIAMVALLGMRREGIITIAASIGLAVVLNWLKANMGAVLLVGGAGVAAYVLGNGQERLSALRGAWKLRAEGRHDEATALLRQAVPWVDARYRRESKRRKKSGAIKPVAEVKHD